jgi:hypothetical protein
MQRAISDTIITGFYDSKYSPYKGRLSIFIRDGFDYPSDSDFQYYDGSWMNLPDKYFLTEKTAVKIMVASVHQNNISSQQREWLQAAKHYTITKLMLLREFAIKYLHLDLFSILFDFTE